MHQQRSHSPRRFSAASPAGPDASSTVPSGHAAQGPPVNADAKVMAAFESGSRNTARSIASSEATLPDLPKEAAPEQRSTRIRWRWRN